jgi:hypothetical protein
LAPKPAPAIQRKEKLIGKGGMVAILAILLRIGNRSPFGRAAKKLGFFHTHSTLGALLLIDEI